MEGPKALAVYVAEDGLVGHQCEKRTLVLSQYRGIPGQKGRRLWVREHPHRSREREDGIEGVPEEKLGKGITFDM